MPDAHESCRKAPSQPHNCSRFIVYTKPCGKAQGGICLFARKFTRMVRGSDQAQPRNLPIRFAAVPRFISHSHTTIEDHPSFLSWPRTERSLRTFLLSFSPQYSSELFGMRLIRHRFAACWCQKQPCTKMAFLSFANAKSGLPGILSACILKFTPNRRITFLTSSSRSDPLERIARMFSLRRLREMLSMTHYEAKASSSWFAGGLVSGICISDSHAPARQLAITFPTECATGGGKAFPT